MVRVWLRPALAALRRQAAPGAYSHVALKAASQQTQSLVAVRTFSSKKDKKSLHDKFVDVEEDLTEVPAEVQFLSKEALSDDDKLDPELIEALEEAELEVEEGGSDSDSDDELDQLEKLLEGQEIDEDDLLDEDDEDDEDSQLTDAEWAAKYERQLSQIELNEARDIEDDRLYIEMPNFDASLSLASEGDINDDDDDDDDDVESEEFKQWKQGMAYSPEMLNWMTPNDQRKTFGTGKDKPWKYFVRANHPDPVELALDVDLLRLFISPTGRIRPRRFTGLTAKQQRQLARGVKISRQLALLPFLSRYPEPSPEQWRAMEEDEIAKLTALAEADDGSMDDDDDDDEFDDMDDE